MDRQLMLLLTCHLVQGTKHTWYAGSYTLINTQVGGGLCTQQQAGRQGFHCWHSIN
jgi:hypothetical protein